MGSVRGLRILDIGMAALAVGCGGESIGQSMSSHAPPPANSSDGGVEGGPATGARLVVQALPPGYPQVWDTEKNIACVPSPVTDGSERCVPLPATSLPYTDPNCTQPVISLAPDECGTTPTYFADSGGPYGCLATKTRTYTAGAPIDTPKELYYHNAGFCTLMGGPNLPLPQGPFAEAVPSDPADWVELEEEVVPVTSTLAAVYWKGADGSRIPNGLQLLPSGKTCEAYPPTAYPPTAVPPQTWCMPTLRAGGGGWYADDTCSGQGLAGSCAPTDIVDGPAGLLEAGNVVSQVYIAIPWDGNKCVPLWTPSGYEPSVFYEMGPPISFDRYPVLTKTISGSGRVQTQYLTTGGKNIFPNSFYDSKFAQPCSATNLSDGKTWCVPGGVVFEAGNAGGYFADPECTRPVAITVPQIDPSQPTFRFALVWPANHYCDRALVPTLRSLERHSGPIYQIDKAAGGTCTESLEWGSNEQIFDYGALINPSDVLAPAPVEP